MEADFSIDHQKSLLKRIREHWVLYLFLFPCILWLIVFCYVPMFGIVLAFKDYNYSLGILGSPWAGLEHFKDFMTSPEFWIVIRNTLVISLLKLVFCFPAPILVALLLNEVRHRKYKSAIQTMTYLPNFVSWVVVVSIMTFLLSPYGGVVNNIRESFGLDPIFYMGEKQYFYPIVVLSDIWKNAGWNSIIYLAAITAIDPELYDSAAVDGAGRLKCTWHVTLPCIKVTIGIMFILAVGGLLSVSYDQIILLQQPSNLDISEVLDTYVIKTGLQQGQFEYATAVGLFKSVFSLILVVSANFLTKKFTEVSLF